ncbi:hypothetical protein C0991_005205 [Blastosporella zonata]|nr:hypothetical protein C0991_005205 [Blastosporella zonata]
MSPKIDHHEQTPVIVPNLSMKDLLDVIPAHCFERSALKSFAYAIWDLFVIGCIYKVTVYAESCIPSLPYPALHGFAWVTLWAIYSFWVGLFGMGVWVVAHECGHQAFSTSKQLNDAVGWVLHSGLGVPYHSWRISHAKHHASTCHMSQDQVFVPWTRKEMGAPEFDPSGEDLLGSSVSQAIKKELWEALGDSPIGASIQCVIYLVRVFPHSPRQKYLILAPISLEAFRYTFFTILLANLDTLKALIVSRTVPIQVNHWLVLITFLQHTDPLIPHYRADIFNFQRGALSTLDRSLLGDLGPVMGWIAAHATNGISETHVLHHVTSKIPHYHAWEAAAALRKKLEGAGIHRQGAPGGWREVYRVIRECKFVEDEGSVVFYKNAYGVAAARPVFPDDEDAQDSGVELNN